MLEAELRDILRKAFSPRDLEWVEPSRGSSVGLPDVTICPLDMPVELKIGSWYGDGFRFTIRPSQIRYHRLAARRRKRTAILIAIPDRIEDDRYTLWLLPGSKLPDDGVVKHLRPQMSRARRVFDSSRDIGELRPSLAAVLTREEFWK